MADDIDTVSIRFHGVQKIVSGGQTGVDRAALDVAIALGIVHGGWCPKGRLAEDGPIAERYQLTELDSADYTVRTERNVIDSDGTLILYQNRLSGGTALTNRFAKYYEKPLHRIRMDRDLKLQAVISWIKEHEIKILNVAGPRGSSSVGIETRAYQILEKIFKQSDELIS